MCECVSKKRWVYVFCLFVCFGVHSMGCHFTFNVHYIIVIIILTVFVIQKKPQIHERSQSIDIIFTVYHCALERYNFLVKHYWLCSWYVKLLNLVGLENTYKMSRLSVLQLVVLKKWKVDSIFIQHINWKCKFNFCVVQNIIV